MSDFTLRREDLSTTLNNLHKCFIRNCFTIRHVALTSDFLLGLHQFLFEAIDSEPAITHKEEDDEQYDERKPTAATQIKRNDKIKSHIYTMNASELWKCTIEDTLRNYWPTEAHKKSQSILIVCSCIKSHHGGIQL